MLAALIFDASFDDRSFPTPDSAFPGVPDIADPDEALLVLGDSSLALLQDMPEYDVASFTQTHANAPYRSAFQDTPPGQFPPTQLLPVLTNELLSRGVFRVPFVCSTRSLVPERIANPAGSQRGSHRRLTVSFPARAPTGFLLRERPVTSTRRKSATFGVCESVETSAHRRLWRLSLHM